MDSKIIERLDVVIDRLNLLIQATVSSKPIPSEIQGDTQKEVLKLCDLEHTPEDMMKKLKKSRTAIDNALLKLRKVNTIKSIKLGNKTVFIRLK